MNNILGAILGLVLTLILVVAVVGYYENAHNASGIAIESSNVATIISGTEALYQGQPGYTGLTTAVAVASNVFPTSMVAGGTPKNQWGGTVTDVVDATPSFFDLTYTGVPQSACVKLSSGYAGEGLQSVTVNGAALPVPPTPAAAAADCVAGNTNKVVWVSE